MFEKKTAKKIAAVVLGCAFALNISAVAFASDGDTVKKDRYEAESAQLKGIDIKSVANAAASGGKKVGWINVPDRDTLTFKINAPAAGEYLIEEGYDNGMGDARQSIVVNGKKYTVQLPSTGSWDEYALSDGVRVVLNEGVNVVVISAKTGFAELDYIDVSAAPAE